MVVGAGPSQRATFLVREGFELSRRNQVGAGVAGVAHVRARAGGIAPTRCTGVCGHTHRPSWAQLGAGGASAVCRRRSLGRVHACCVSKRGGGLTAPCARAHVRGSAPCTSTLLARPTAGRWAGEGVSQRATFRGIGACLSHQGSGHRSGASAGQLCVSTCEGCTGVVRILGGPCRHSTVTTAMILRLGGGGGGGRVAAA